MKGQPKTDAGRLPLFVMIGFSILLHGLFITGLPNLPWFSRPPDIFRLTRYVVRFRQAGADVGSRADTGCRGRAGPHRTGAD